MIKMWLTNRKHKNPAEESCDKMRKIETRIEETDCYLYVKEPFKETMNVLAGRKSFLNDAT